MAESLAGSRVVQKALMRPVRLVPLAFLAVITVGTLLLLLPWAHAGEGSATLVAAAFTAVSATCVTGLTAVDTATYWTPFGQAVILALAQIGGLGIMTGATLLGLLVGCVSRQPFVPPVTDFDLDRYLGTWYEIARPDHSFQRFLLYPSYAASVIHCALLSSHAHTLSQIVL